MSRICAVAMAAVPGELVSRARAALSAGADLIELRLDHLRPLTAATLEAALDAARGTGLLGTGKVVVSIRAKRDGGAFGDEETNRRELLGIAAAAGAAWLDLEGWLPVDEVRLLARRARASGTMTLLSWHLNRPDALDRAPELAIDVATGGSADAVKLVLPVEDRADLDAFLALSRRLAEEEVPHVLLPSGRLSRLGRLLAPLTETEWVYAELPEAGDGGVLGPLGLPLVRDLDDAWRRMGMRPALDLGTMTPPPMVPGDAGGWKLLAILGDPVSHTLSPAIHHAALAAIGKPGAYLPLRTPKGTVVEALEELEAAGAVGCNVTVPVKVEAAGAVDELAEAARLSGAVNTVVLEGEGRRVGENTDAVGVERAATELLGPRGTGRTALVLGTGGSARGAAVGLAGWGAGVLATGRDPTKLSAMAEAIGGLMEAVAPERLGDLRGGVDLLVQCTTQGMEAVPPSGPLAPLKVLEAIRPRAVLDLVYVQGGTELVRWAWREGLPAAGGERVLLHQAAASFELWMRSEPPFEAMEAALREASRPVMPGVGEGSSLD